MNSYRCKTLDQAKQILKENNIPFDNIYEMVYSKPNEYGIVKEVRGVHAYFNNGNSLNVAYYTPDLEVLSIIENKGRADGTDLINRHILWRK